MNIVVTKKMLYKLKSLTREGARHEEKNPDQMRKVGVSYVKKKENVAEDGSTRGDCAAQKIYLCCF